jgi:hypothetical protein
MLERKRCDPRALAALTYSQIAARYPRYIRALLWLRACRVIRREDFVRVVWPDLSGRQTHAHGLRQLLRAKLVEAIDEQQRVLKLGIRGARVLNDAWIRSSYRTSPRERVLPGLLLASEFATALGAQLMHMPSVRDLVWIEAPFAGSGVRPDGAATIWCTTMPHANERFNAELLKVQRAEPLGPDERVLEVYLEIDRASQFGDKLEERIRNWAVTLDSPAYAQPANRHMIAVLWLTAGTWRRARTIHAAWTAAIRQPALFSTVYQLRGKRETGLMDPLGEMWLDIRGRGMRGWNLFEATWR